MKLNISITTNLKIKAVQDKVKQASERAFKNVIIDIANDVVKGSPVARIGGGTNRRSIQFEIEGLKGSVFSTSGYGGFLEVGTVRMPARSYFKPAGDMHIKKLPEEIKKELK